MARYVRLRDTSFLRATATHAALISVVVSFIAVFASDESLPYSAQAGDGEVVVWTSCQLVQQQPLLPYYH